MRTKLEQLPQRENLSPTAALAYWHERAEINAKLMTIRELPPPATFRDSDRRLTATTKLLERLAALDQFSATVVEAPPSGPALLSTPILAGAFSGLNGWSDAAWKKYLGNRPKWLGAPTAPGARGVSPAMWNPVRVAAALVQWTCKGDKKAQDRLGRSVRAKFQTNPLLHPWLEAWKDYEAEYLTLA